MPGDPLPWAAPAFPVLGDRPPEGPGIPGCPPFPSGTPSRGRTWGAGAGLGGRAGPVSGGEAAEAARGGLL